MPKVKNKVKKIQIDGSNYEQEFEPTTVAQLFGETGFDKYNTLNENEYEYKITNMNKTDLQEHAIKIGLIPVDNRAILQQRLMREFKKHVATYHIPKTKKHQASKNSNKIPDDVAKILDAGR